ncbi:hypothetical protein [Staphylothermus hellenicus]|uniref:Archaeal Type IV pilin N-terminal domain-containing protein n=1 Tax=Staphylothermus hellenicus (strain DSM 12710 / JCM 10830 / BK20S6-10-b1 / P8) TaxID=591019 RepID=D7D8H9_STAHD|nr:hypothetical protein [Staphylothermus hellenicus]ADI32075.1 hypothetical protein Shell_0969 [Staphylothermus hellenicus DSM 12710]
MKAVDPVIATVIIVAVAIAISIAVALWITGLTSSFTGVEKLEIVNAYVVNVEDTSPDDTSVDHPGWNITVIVKNTGTKPVTIDGVFINNKPGDAGKVYTKYVSNPSSGNPHDTNPVGAGLTINPGEQKTLYFYLSTVENDSNSPVSDKFSSGETVSIVIHTASGGQYPATVTLP